MTTNNILKDLFAQIIHSEEKVRERSAKLKQVNDEIEDFRTRTTEIREEIKSFQGNLVIKSQKVAEQELQLKWLTEKMRIFADQKQGLEEQKTGLETSLKKIRENSENERLRFIEEAQQFCSMYDLLSDGRKKREIDRKKKFEEIIVSKEKLKTEIQVIIRQKNEIGCLEGKKKKLLSQIGELEVAQEGIDKSIKAKKDKTGTMEVEKMKVSKRAQCDPEFQRISTELQTCKENSLSLEGICDAMNQELTELQRQFYQKQLQKQRKHRQEQKQQQQQHKKHLQQQKNQQHWQGKQHAQHQWQPQHPQASREKCKAYHGQLPEKGIQKPLLENDSQRNGQQKQDDVSHVNLSNAATTSRFQQHSKSRHFHY